MYNPYSLNDLRARKTEKLVENKIEPKNPMSRTGLLFSGGVDSFYSLVNNIHHNPQMVMLWGVDDFPYPDRADHWEKTIQIYSEYAERKNLDIFLLKTNICQILNEKRLRHTFYKELYYGAIRSTLGHSTVLLGPVAPISIGRFDKLIIAASNELNYDYKLRPNGANPEADEKIKWADLSVKHDGLVERNMKIEKIVEHHGDEDFTLRVCSRSRFENGSLNCGKCQKCLNTSVFLTLIGLDPNLYGFKVDDSSFQNLRSLWGNKRWASRRARFWRETQDMIPAQIDFDVPGANEFFEWFRDIDLESLEKETNWFYTDLYMWLPFSLAKILRQVYYKFGIGVHGWPYNHSYASTLEEQKLDDN